VKTVRAAAHVHSEWSYDAAWSLDAIVRAFSRRRYDVVLMSEHDRGFDDDRWERYQAACRTASTDRLLLIPGIEYEDPDHVVHIPVWGKDVPFLGESSPTLDTLLAARNHGAVAVFAHPWQRDAISRYKPEWGKALSAVEVWNRKYDGIAPNRAAAAFAQSESLLPFASLDFHTRRQFFPLAMKLDLGEEPSIGAVVESLRNGRCSPSVAGRSVLRFTHGIEALAANALETTRRVAARQARRLRRQL
jgi:predicted metal-dependent phosphoesterase TrpH